MSISSNISNSLQQYFDKILVISVPRFKERHAHVQQQLQGLPFEFFMGTDKLQMDMEKINAAGMYDEKLARHLSRHGKAMSEGEIACSLSHLGVYKMMVENNWQRILIFEDDVAPDLDNLHLIPDTLNELPGDWEFVYFGYLKHENVTTALLLKQFFYKIFSALGLMKWSYKMVSNLLPTHYSAHVKKAGFHDCLHAYAISLEGARKLIAAQTPVVYRADDLAGALIMKGTIKGFVTEPKFFNQEGFTNQQMISEIKR